MYNFLLHLSALIRHMWVIFYKKLRKNIKYIKTAMKFKTRSFYFTAVLFDGIVCSKRTETNKTDFKCHYEKIKLFFPNRNRQVFSILAVWVLQAITIVLKTRKNVISDPDFFVYTCLYCGTKRTAFSQSSVGLKDGRRYFSFASFINQFICP